MKRAVSEVVRLRLFDVPSYRTIGGSVDDDSVREDRQLRGVHHGLEHGLLAVIALGTSLQHQAIFERLDPELDNSMGEILANSPFDLFKLIPRIGRRWLRQCGRG